MVEQMGEKCQHCVQYWFISDNNTDNEINKILVDGERS